MKTAGAVSGGFDLTSPTAVTTGDAIQIPWLIWARLLPIAIGIAAVHLLVGCSTSSQRPNRERPTDSAKLINAVRQHHLSLSLQSEVLAICKLSPDASVPDWAWSPGAFHNISRTPEELSIVCPESAVPNDVKKESGWRILKVDGPLDFSLTGILASIAGPLAEAGISIFAISTYDTDYVMVKSEKVEEAIRVLTKAGHLVKRESPEHGQLGATVRLSAIARAFTQAGRETGFLL